MRKDGGLSVPLIRFTSYWVSSGKTENTVASTANEAGVIDPMYMANGFEVNLEFQPDLAKADGGLHGVAGPGDLLYIPCGHIHTLASIGPMVSLAWIPTEKDMPQCPNENGRSKHGEYDS